MPPRRDPRFTFPLELTQLIQQQNALMQILVQNQNQGNNNNNNPPPPPVDHLTRFLRLNPPVFSSSTEPIVADDWLRICASCSGQLPSYLTEPIICYYRLGATGKHRRIQPKKTG